MRLIAMKEARLRGWMKQAFLDRDEEAIGMLVKITCLDSASTFMQN